ncbi:glycine-rich protein 1-like [Panicum virgatum]|uniref:glycine-rich protein 1-like n=1 Tax=Panicum virgatum TaxID=38727 RepID=UPI0019D6666C|nr:glycine-rich protein 1-like [Panicum virgatum]
MAVGAGVNGGRGSARRRDASGRRRPLQASLCRGRRRLYGVNGGGVRAAGGPVPWPDASRLGERVHARARTSGPGAGTRPGSGSGAVGRRRAGPGGGVRGAAGAGWARPGRGLVRAEPLQGGACAGGLGKARARGARWQAERGRGGVPGGRRALRAAAWHGRAAGVAACTARRAAARLARPRTRGEV